MENASQALLIAATILIALIVLSIGIYLISNSSRVGESYEQTQELNEVTKFNSKFTVFVERDDITAQEVLTLYNFVENYNQNNDPDVDFSPKITNKVNFLKSLDGEIQLYECKEDDIDYTNGKVSSIKFTKK